MAHLPRGRGFLAVHYRCVYNCCMRIEIHLSPLAPNFYTESHRSLHTLASRPTSAWTQARCDARDRGIMDGPKLTRQPKVGNQRRQCQCG